MAFRLLDGQLVLDRMKTPLGIVMEQIWIARLEFAKISASFFSVGTRNAGKRENARRAKARGCDDPSWTRDLSIGMLY